LTDLKGADLDLALLGFTEGEVAALLAETAPEGAPSGEEGKTEKIPEAPVEPVTRPGDLWLSG
jgi:hypothetical protein